MATITSLSFRMNSLYNGEGMRQARQDIARLDSSMNALEKSSKNLVPGFRELTSVILGLGPALVPIAGGLLAIGGAASSAFALAGSAVGIYAIAMKGAISSTVGASSAFGQTNTAIKTAEKQLALTTKGTKEYDKALKKVTEAEKAHEEAIKQLPPVQEEFARGYDQASLAITKFNNDNAKFTLGPAITAMEAFVLALPKFTKVIQAMSPEIQNIADSTKSWVQDGGLDRFIKYLVDFGVPAFRNFRLAVVRLLTGLGEGMRAFAPMGLEFTEWVKNAAGSFSDWATGGGFERFLTWLQENGPALIDVARDLGKFLANVGTAVGDMAPAAFTVLGAFLKVLASFPPGLIQALAYAWIAWNGALIVFNTVAFIAAAATTAMTLAATPFGLLMLGAALTIGAVVLAIIALGVAIFFLVKHWDTVWGAIKDSAKAVWDWLKMAWEETWNFVKNIAMTVWDWLTTGWGQLLLFFLPFGPLLLIWQNWDTIWTMVKDTASSVWGWITDTWSIVVGALNTAWQAAISPLVDSWNTVWPEMNQAAMNVWTGLKVAWDFLWTGITLVWEVFWGTFGPAFQAAWKTLTGVATGLWDTLVAAWQTVWSVIQGTYQVAWAILSGAWSVGWAYLTGAAKIAWAAFTGAWEVVWSVVTGIWNTFYAIFSGIFTTAWNVIVALATGLWNMIKAAWDALWKSVTAIFMVFTAVFTGNWSAAWTAIKDAAAAIWNVMRTAWQTFLNAVMAVLTGFINTAKAAWSAFWTAIQTVATTFWNAVRTLFTTFLNAVRDLWNAGWTAVRTIFQTIVTAIMTIATNWWATFRTAINTFLDFVKNLWNTAWTTIRTFFNTAATGIRTIADTLWDGLRAIFSAGSTWLRTTFWNPVNNFFTKTIPDAFNKGKELIGKAWDGIRKLVRDPIQAIVNVVYNNGIVKLWNTVAKVFGADGLKEFNLPQFREGGPTGAGSSNGFLAKLHPNEHVWTAREVAAAGGHDAVARMRSQALGGRRVRAYGDHSFEDGGGFLGTGIGPKVGPDLVPDGIIQDIGGAIGGAINKLKGLALGAISGPFGAAVDAVAKAGKATVRGIIPGSGTLMEQLGTGMIDKVAETIKDWVKQNDVAPDIGGNGFAPWAAWKEGDGTRVNYGGVTVNRRTAAMLKNASRIAKTTFSMFQGSYSNSVGASAGTHSGGGAVDLGPAKDSIVGAMRASGFAAWRRTQAEGFSPHIHGIAVGDHTLSPQAAAQVKAFQAGRNGLANNGPDTYTAAGGGGNAKSIAKGLLTNYGWASHWSALEALWQRESGWNYKAKNPSSGAYGIPQALPASKMKSAGADYLTNPATQIKWGLSYIKSRYGNPTKANSFQKANNWYGRGTYSAFPGMAVVGDTGPELMKMRGGEKIEPFRDLTSGDSGRGGIVLEEGAIQIDARGATPAAVDKLHREFPDALRVALHQGTGLN